MRSSGLSKAYLKKKFLQEQGNQLSAEKTTGLASSEYRTSYSMAEPSSQSRLTSSINPPRSLRTETPLHHSRRSLHHSINTLGLGSQLPMNEIDIMPAYPKSEWLPNKDGGSRWSDHVGDFMWGQRSHPLKATQAAVPMLQQQQSSSYHKSNLTSNIEPPAKAALKSYQNYKNGPGSQQPAAKHVHFENDCNDHSSSSQIIGTSKDDDHLERLQEQSVIVSPKKPYKRSEYEVSSTIIMIIM